MYLFTILTLYFMKLSTVLPVIVAISAIALVVSCGSYLMFHLEFFAVCSKICLIAFVGSALSCMVAMAFEVK